MKTLITTTINTFKRTLLASATVALLATSGLAFAPQADAAVFISVNFAPPPMPVYEQPAIPAEGYVWTPGYWAYDDQDGYYWVAGMWVQAPYVGALWTPGYWGWSNGAYVFHDGYWSDHVGYYGGINYGFGYCGEGYQGGYWNRGSFYYNVTVNRIENVHITNIYNRTVINNVTINHYSFNGPGGVTRRATAAELAFAHERHIAAVGAQIRQQSMASHNQASRATTNRGKPPIAAAARAGDDERAAETLRTAPKAAERPEVRSLPVVRADQERTPRAAFERGSQRAIATHDGRAMPAAAHAVSTQPMRRNVSVAGSGRPAPTIAAEPRRTASVHAEVERQNLASRAAPVRAVVAPRVAPHASRKA